MKRNYLTMSVACVSVLIGSGNFALAQPSSMVCGSSGGAEICVRFDNLADPPVETADFDFTFAFGVPSVEFKQGDNGAGTTYEWRVWAWNNSTSKTAQAINNIFGNQAEDYKVTLLQPDDTAGATKCPRYRPGSQQCVQFLDSGGRTHQRKPHRHGVPASEHHPRRRRAHVDRRR